MYVYMFLCVSIVVKLLKWRVIDARLLIKSVKINNYFQQLRTNIAKFFSRSRHSINILLLVNSRTLFDYLLIFFFSSLKSTYIWKIFHFTRGLNCVYVNVWKEEKLHNTKLFIQYNLKLLICNENVRNIEKDESLKHLHHILT